MEVKFKKLDPNGIIPKYAIDGDCGLDLNCVGMEDNGIQVKYNTGIAVEIPYGFVGLLFPRSSVCKKDLSLANSIGVIDSNFRGPIVAVFNRILNGNTSYQIGERCCQLVILKCPHIIPVEADELSDTSRNQNAFGSTGA